MEVRLLPVTFALLTAVLTAPATASAADEPKVSVMVLGTYHFGNPGKDVNNIQVDDVLTPVLQAELEAVATALLKFKPTRVMVERESDAPDFQVADYAQFSPAMLKEKRNETVQIGYRVANLAGLKTVEGIDEQPKSGEPDYFPFDKLSETAKRLGQTAIIDQANQNVQVWLKAFEAKQRTATIGALLADMNNLSSPAGGMDFYYKILKVGDQDTQSGADLNAMWYLRNAKIFSKLMRASKPGDRVLVIYGSGHAYWLNHFASVTPGYLAIDPLPYLKRIKPVGAQK